MVAAKQRLLTGLVIVINFLILCTFNATISMHFLLDVLYTFPMLLSRRICITIKMFLVGYHFLYSHDLYVSFSHDAIRRNKMLVSPGNFNGQVS